MKRSIMIPLFIGLLAQGYGSLSAYPWDHRFADRLTCKDYITPVPDLLHGTIDITQVKHNNAVAVTMWGDSLTELVIWYGNKPPVFFGNGIPWGDYGGLPYNIDSFDDYFTIFGNNFASPIKVQNIAKSMNTTDDLVSRISGSTNQCDPLDQNSNHTGGTAARSLVMIGGNDNIAGRLTSLWLPFLSQHINNHAVDNIRYFIDWNIENGKEVLLEGTFPIKSDAISNYDASVITRSALCTEGPTAPPPPDIPWYYWLLDPKGTRALVNAYVSELKYIAAQWDHFLRASVQGGFFPVLIRSSSMGQACLNDRLMNEVQPGYEQAGYFPGWVRIRSMYSEFALDSSTQANFWVANPAYYEGGDMVHIGASGYKLWGQLMGNELRQIGWNQLPSTVKAPVDGNLVSPPPPPPPSGGGGGGCDINCLILCYFFC